MPSRYTDHDVTAAIAILAMLEGRSAAVAVADHYGCTEGTARNRIGQARAAGYDIPHGKGGHLPGTQASGQEIEFDYMAWRADAACNDHDPDVFFPDRGQSSAEARRICAGCLVRDECLQYALDNEIKHGVWGGTSETERRKMRRDRRLQQRAAYRELIA